MTIPLYGGSGPSPTYQVFFTAGDPGASLTFDFANFPSVMAESQDQLSAQNFNLTIDTLMPGIVLFSSDYKAAFNGCNVSSGSRHLYDQRYVSCWLDAGGGPKMSSLMWEGVGERRYTLLQGTGISENVTQCGSPSEEGP